MNEVIPILWRWVLANFTMVKSFTIRIVSVKLYNFRVPVYKGVPLPWMKWNVSLNYNCRQSIQVGKDLLSPKLYILLLRGWEIFILIHNSQVYKCHLPTHEINGLHPLTICRVYSDRWLCFPTLKVTWWIHYVRVPVFNYHKKKWLIMLLVDTELSGTGFQ